MAPARAKPFWVTHRQLLCLAGDRLPGGYRRRFARYRYDPVAFELDSALEDPISRAAPARAPTSRRVPSCGSAFGEGRGLCGRRSTRLGGGLDLERNQPKVAPCSAKQQEDSDAREY